MNEAERSKRQRILKEKQPGGQSFIRILEESEGGQAMNFLITLYIFSAVFALMALVAWICERRERRRARCKIRAMRKGERRKAA